MPISPIVAAQLAGQSSEIAETVVDGIGTLLGGLNKLINPTFEIPPFIGMASADFMKMGIAALMASNNTNLQFAKQEAAVQGFARELYDEITVAEQARELCSAKFGAKARANNAKNGTFTAKPTMAELEKFYKSAGRLIAVQNTQNAHLRLYKQYASARNASNFDFKGLLRKIIKGTGTVFTYIDRAKQVYDKARPYLEKI